MKKNKSALLDTNILIRFLTSDNKYQADKVAKLLQSAAEKSLEITDVVFVEIIFVLLSFYLLSKEEILIKMRSILQYPAIKTNNRLLEKALTIFEYTNISFVDAYTCAKSSLEKKVAYSFDKKMQVVKESSVREPK